MSIMRYASRKVKPARRTPRPAAPFGAGILRSIPDAGRMPFVAADLDWAAQAFADGGPDWDEMAAERAWEQAYEAGMIVNDRCVMCGLEAPDGTTNGVCSDCAEILDRDGEIGDGGICVVCHRPVDFLEDSGLCLPCDMAASEKHSSSGPRGF